MSIRSKMQVAIHACSVLMVEPIPRVAIQISSTYGKVGGAHPNLFKGGGGHSNFIKG